MHGWRRFKRWPRVLAACSLLVAAELGLRLFPVKTWAKFATRMHRLPLRLLGALSPEKTAAALFTADHHLVILEPSCLRRAFAMRLLFGHDAPIHIGVNRMSSDKIEAHAWTEWDEDFATESAKFEELGVI